MNRNKQIIIAFMLCISVFGSAFGQVDPLFSQFYLSPMNLNPAMMGVYQGQWRFNANYRQQWTDVFATTPVRTIHASADMRFNIVDQDYLAVGVNAIKDEAGGDSKLQSTKGNFGLSYMKQLGSKSYRSGADQFLIFGGQIGTGQQTLTNGSLWFDRQYDSTNYSINRNAASGEFEPKSNMYMDINAGLMYYALWAENKSFYVGAAMQHINRPSVTFFGGGLGYIYRRLTFHAGGEIPFGDELSILPASIVTMQGPSMTTQLGANIRYSNHDWNEVAVRVGAWYRIVNNSGFSFNGIGNTRPTLTNLPNIEATGSTSSDALTFAAILEMDRWQLGFSYDAQVSNIATPTNSRGAFEISLIYVHPETHKVKTNCPHF
jgi:type IX secretion system PorP/SprF family membrane protein